MIKALSISHIIIGALFGGLIGSNLDGLAFSLLGILAGGVIGQLYYTSKFNI